MKTFHQSKALFLAQAAMIAAIYVVLTVLGASLAFGEVQIRFSEALTILPAFTPAGIPGVFLGCLISNILGGAILPDIIFGSLATLIGAVFTWLLRNQSRSGTAPPHCRKRGCGSFYPEIRLSGSAANSLYDAHRRNWRGDFMRNTGYVPLQCSESLPQGTVHPCRIKYR